MGITLLFHLGILIKITFIFFIVEYVFIYIALAADKNPEKDWLEVPQPAAGNADAGRDRQRSSSSSSILRALEYVEEALKKAEEELVKVKNEIEAEAKAEAKAIRRERERRAEEDRREDEQERREVERRISFEGGGLHTLDKESEALYNKKKKQMKLLQERSLSGHLPTVLAALFLGNNNPTIEERARKLKELEKELQLMKEEASLKKEERERVTRFRVSLLWEREEKRREKNRERERRLREEEYFTRQKNEKKRRKRLRATEQALEALLLSRVRFEPLQGGERRRRRGSSILSLPREVQSGLFEPETEEESKEYSSKETESSSESSDLTDDEKKLKELFPEMLGDLPPELQQALTPEGLSVREELLQRNREVLKNASSRVIKKAKKRAKKRRNAKEKEKAVRRMKSFQGLSFLEAVHLEERVLLESQQQARLEKAKKEEKKRREEERRRLEEERKRLEEERRRRTLESQVRHFFKEDQEREKREEKDKKGKKSSGKSKKGTPCRARAGARALTAERCLELNLQELQELEVVQRRERLSDIQCSRDFWVSQRRGSIQGEGVQFGPLTWLEQRHRDEEEEFERRCERRLERLRQQITLKCSREFGIFGVTDEEVKRKVFEECLSSEKEELKAVLEKERKEMIERHQEEKDDEKKDDEKSGESSGDKKDGDQDRRGDGGAGGAAGAAGGAAGAAGGAAGGGAGGAAGAAGGAAGLLTKQGRDEDTPKSKGGRESSTGSIAVMAGLRRGFGRSHSFSSFSLPRPVSVLQAVRGFMEGRGERRASKGDVQSKEGAVSQSASLGSLQGEFTDVSSCEEPSGSLKEGSSGTGKEESNLAVQKAVKVGSDTGPFEQKRQAISKSSSLESGEEGNSCRKKKKKKKRHVPSALLMARWEGNLTSSSDESSDEEKKKKRASIVKEAQRTQGENSSSSTSSDSSSLLRKRSSSSSSTSDGGILSSSSVVKTSSSSGNRETSMKDCSLREEEKKDFSTSSDETGKVKRTLEMMGATSRFDPYSSTESESSGSEGGLNVKMIFTKSTDSCSMVVEKESTLEKKEKKKKEKEKKRREEERRKRRRHILKKKAAKVCERSFVLEREKEWGEKKERMEGGGSSDNSFSDSDSGKQERKDVVCRVEGEVCFFGFSFSSDGEPPDNNEAIPPHLLQMFEGDGEQQNSDISDGSTGSTSNSSVDSSILEEGTSPEWTSSDESDERSVSGDSEFLVAEDDRPLAVKKKPFKIEPEKPIEYNMIGQEQSFIGLQQFLSVSIQDTQDALKNLQLQTKRQKRKKESILSLFAAMEKRQSSVYAHNNPYTSQIGIIAEPQIFNSNKCCKIGLSYNYSVSHTDSLKNESVKKVQGYAKLKIHTHIFSSIGVWNPYDEGITGYVEGSYGVGKSKNTRYIQHNFMHIGTKGFAPIEIKGFSTGMGYRIACTPQIFISPYIQYSYVVSKGDQYKEDTGYFAKIFSSKESVTEGSVGVDIQMLFMDKIQIHGWLEGGVGKQNIQDMYLMIQSLHNSIDFLVPAESRRYKKMTFGLSADIYLSPDIGLGVYGSIQTKYANHTYRLEQSSIGIRSWYDF